MTSLRRRLFLLLISATAAIWVCAVGWIYFANRADLEHVLDTRLQEAARMVHSMVASSNLENGGVAAASAADFTYNRQLSCQVWSMSGRLLARSGGAPEDNLAEEREGFSDRLVNGEVWRVYTVVDPEHGVRVAVGDRLGLRARLARDLIVGLVGPALLAVPLLGLMIWASLGRGLAPLRRIAGEIAGRAGDDVSPVASEGAPDEVRPLIAALNGLFVKVEAARRHEKEMTAFAAHELRTPLAGLKTQAQVALAAKDAPTRDGALRQIITSVDRASRLVRQLLALARLEALPEVEGDGGALNLGALVREVVAGLPRRPEITVMIDDALDGLEIRADRDSLYLVVRNLQENAAEHIASPGRVVWSVLPGRVGLAIEDDGPGIPDDELPEVTRRFFRGRHRSGSGSGLGLTIADLAARRIGAKLVFANRIDAPGLRVEIRFCS
ncbi:sensor histidine kinase [Pleomorphomonas oryzae]|uniref:sensor histidine kinase n=1 Tax=Pleomorphomonas oryzae TaxID=261934 RepID=UPI00041B8D82|nr:sensor histidine kinase [Pleomorphomonas oryzae]